MASFKNILLVILESVITSFIVLYIFFNSSKLYINILGALIMIAIETKIINRIREELKHELPDSPYKRESIIFNFTKNHYITINSENRQTIVEASYYSEEWEQILREMTYEYANLGIWFKHNNDKMSWLRIYLAVFPVKEITSDMEEQYSIVVEKHFTNLVKEINKKEFDTIEDIINYVNSTFYLTFDKNSFAAWNAFMKEKKHVIKLKNMGQIGVDSEINRLVRKYENE